MFDKFHLCDNAQIVTGSIPGEESVRLLEEQERYESSNRSYPRSIPIAFDTAKGSIIQDVDGNRYIDFTSSCGVLNLGHNNEYILEKIRKIENQMLLIANTAEAFQDILNETAHTEEGKRRIKHELALSQRSFLWEGDDKVILTPSFIPETLFNHNTQALGLKNVLNVSPGGRRIDLCKAVLEDSNVLALLVRIVQSNPGIKISPYAVTKDFLGLIERLRELKLDFRAPEVPSEESFWTIEYLDSKSGFREHILSSFSNIPLPNIPKGFICKNLEQGIQAGRWFINKGKSCVMKANMGKSGWGILILKVDCFKNLNDFEKYARTIFLQDSIWRQLPIIVEEFIPPLLSVAGGTPSVEAYVTSARVQITYMCGQEISPQGEFLGITLGPEVLPSKLSRVLSTKAKSIGQSFLRLGYRGFFDIDFVLDKTGHPYVLESNTRRTGGTHVFDLMRWIMKKNEGISKPYLLSCDSFVYGANVVSPEAVLKKSEKLLYPMNGSNTGIVISLIHAEDSVIGYIVIGNNRKHVNELNTCFIDLWRHPS